MPVLSKPAIRQEVKGTVQGFRQFINQYTVIPLAIGVVIGNSVNDLVKTIVAGIITPLVSLLSPSTKLQSFQIEVGTATFKIGEVLNATITFLFVAWIVYLAVRFILRDEQLLKKS